MKIKRPFYKNLLNNTWSDDVLFNCQESHLRRRITQVSVSHTGTLVFGCIYTGNGWKAFLSGCQFSVLGQIGYIFSFVLNNLSHCAGGYETSVVSFNFKISPICSSKKGVISWCVLKFYCSVYHERIIFNFQFMKLIDPRCISTAKHEIEAFTADWCLFHMSCLTIPSPILMLQGEKQTLYPHNSQCIHWISLLNNLPQNEHNL